MREDGHERPHIVLFHLYEMSRNANPWGHKVDGWLLAGGEEWGWGLFGG